MEGAAPLHGDDGAARPGHLRSHAAEEALQVLHLGLPGGPHDDGGPFRPAGGQHEVLGGPHAGQGQADLPAGQAGGPRPGQQGPLLLPDLRPQGPQGGQVQVDGPRAQLTAPGIAQLGLPRPGQQGPQEDHRGAHLPHEAPGDVPALQPGGVHPHRVPLPLRPAAQQPQDVQGGGHVGQVGAVGDDALPRGQEGSGQDGQDAVLGPLDLQPSPQGPPAPDLIAAHRIALPIWLDLGHPMPGGGNWFQELVLCACLLSFQSPEGPWGSVLLSGKYGLPRRACGPPRNDEERSVPSQGRADTQVRPYEQCRSRRAGVSPRPIKPRQASGPDHRDTRRRTPTPAPAPSESHRSSPRRRGRPWR